MPRTDPGLPLLALISAASWTAAVAAAVADLAAVAAVLAVTPSVVGAYRDRQLGSGLALAGAAVYGAVVLWTGTGIPSAALDTVAITGLGLVVAAAIGTAAGEASAYRVWYHALRDRLPAATLFVMPSTGRVHDLNGRAATLLGQVRRRSLAESFVDPGAYSAFAADVAAGEVVRRGAWIAGPAGTPRWCELSGAMATPVLAVVSIDDRTAERAAADALAASESVHRALVAHAPGAALLVDEDLRIDAAGGELLPVLAGQDSGVAGRTLWTAFPDRVAQALEPVARLAAFGTAGTDDFEMDGRRFLLAAAPVPGGDGTVAGAALAIADATALAGRLAECDERRGVANALLGIYRAGGAEAAERLLAAALRATGSRYGAVVRVDGGTLAPLAVTPALADADLALLAGDAALRGVPAVRETAPDEPLPLRRILAVPVTGGVVAVADRASPYTEREIALVRALACEGFGAAARAADALAETVRAGALAAAFDCAPLPLLAVDGGGRVVRENHAARALFGDGAPERLALRIAGPDRNRVATIEDRRRRGDLGVPGRYPASVLGADGEVVPCLIAAARNGRDVPTVLALVDLGPAAALDACRDRALAALEARLEASLASAGDDPTAFGEAVRAAWRASVRERAILATPTAFEDVPPGCGDYA
jgi:PAS domain-containing protein